MKRILLDSTLGRDLAFELEFLFLVAGSDIELLSQQVQFSLKRREQLFEESFHQAPYLNEQALCILIQDCAVEVGALIPKSTKLVRFRNIVDVDKHFIPYRGWIVSTKSS